MNLDVIGFGGEQEERRQAEIKWKALMEKWARQELPETAMDTKYLAFFLLDITHSTTFHPTNLPTLLADFDSSISCFLSSSVGGSTPDAPLIRLFGVTREGLSVVLHVHGFFPYLYCEAHPTNNLETVEEGAHTLRSYLAACLDRNMDHVVVQIVEKESLLYYKPRRPIGSLPKVKDSPVGLHPSYFYKIIVQSQKQIPTVRTAIQDYGLDWRLGNDRGGRLLRNGDVFEATIPFELRYMVDAGITGCGWIEVPLSKCFVRPANQRESTSGSFEADIFFGHLLPHPPEGEWEDIPRLRILSFDIECVKLDGAGFPVATDDPVIQISSVMNLHGDNDPFFRSIFTLEECAPIAGAQVFWFSDESQMLSKWTELIQMTDPDILTGYNCINFDLTYLLDRAKALNLEQFRCLSRLKFVKSVARDQTFSSRAIGTHENKEINMDGRVQLDMMEAVRREHKLKSYTLNNVSFTFLQEQKEDVHYSSIRDLQQGGPETRKRVAVYCLKDAYLPLRLLSKLLVLYNYVEMARVTGCPLPFLLTRGQQIRVMSQLLRHAKVNDYVIPSPKRSGGDGSVQYEGATVLEPLKGFYQKPVATLDFASLYPSIIMAHNLCYSSLVLPEDVSAVDKNDLTVTTTSAPYYFIKSSVRKGLLPSILESLISARKKAKKQMAEATDSFRKKVYNGRQLALKVTANSVYGFTGATTGGILPCLQIATSTTCYGRDMIEETKRLVEREYCVSNGYAFNCRVIYGDTDSIMVDFTHHRPATANENAPSSTKKTEALSLREQSTKAQSVRNQLELSIEEVMELGKDAAQRINEHFPKPIKLEFEKVYFPFLLMNKKRYAGVIYTKPDNYDRKDCKGIETVRRDFCILVQRTVDRVLNKMLLEFDVQGAQQLTRDTIAQLLQNQVDMSLLVVTKSLGKTDYAVQLPHVRLAEKLKQRDPGTAPAVGDRVSYIVVKGRKGQPQYDRAEDPLYALDNNLAIDVEHYLECLKNPIVRIFEGVMKDPDSLFSGAHTRVKTVLSSNSNKVMKSFVVKVPQCLGCQTVLKNVVGPFCARCSSEEKQQEIILQKASVLRQKEKDFNALWTQCQRCQGSLHLEVICSSRDCPIFYRRMKTRKDVAAAQNDFNKLSLEW